MVEGVEAGRLANIPFLLLLPRLFELGRQIIEEFAYRCSRRFHLRDHPRTGPVRRPCAARVRAHDPRTFARGSSACGPGRRAGAHGPASPRGALRRSAFRSASPTTTTTSSRFVPASPMPALPCALLLRSWTPQSPALLSSLSRRARPCSRGGRAGRRGRSFFPVAESPWIILVASRLRRPLASEPFPVPCLLSCAFDRNSGNWSGTASARPIVRANALSLPFPAPPKGSSHGPP